ncbi:MAG TPA: hypothetical protein VFV41_17580 [Streptosporangiaceae bacterium]|nr:hypothetical protein [Streptosporangiaceae bacterium]
MATYLFSYRAPAGYQPGGADAAERWKAWFQSLGSSVHTLGNPVGETAEVGNCGPGTRLGGYSLITADDHEAALAIAKSCPAVEMGAGLDVGQLIEVPREARPA